MSHLLLTWRDLLMLAVGVVLGPALWLGVAFVWCELRDGSWASLDNLCDCPKDGRTMRPMLIHSMPRPGLWPLRRCPVCGSRWTRTYLRRAPGAERLLRLMWAKPPAYTDDEIEARWEHYERTHGGVQ